ncbi:hypothetical protein DID99_36150 [Burkholderia sp. Bp8986]|nr:hypothetical protein DID99_36150 [Burkholderia sp. Bp8986]
MRSAAQSYYTAFVKAVLPLLETMPQKDQILLLGDAGEGVNHLGYAIAKGDTEVIEALLPLLKKMPLEDQIRLLSVEFGYGRTCLFIALQECREASITALLPLLDKMPQKDQISLLNKRDTLGGGGGLWWAVVRRKGAVLEALRPLLEKMPEEALISLLGGCLVGPPHDEKFIDALSWLREKYLSRLAPSVK